MGVFLGGVQEDNKLLKFWRFLKQDQKPISNIPHPVLPGKYHKTESRHKFNMSPNKIICYRLGGPILGKLISLTIKDKQ